MYIQIGIIISCFWWKSIIFVLILWKKVSDVPSFWGKMVISDVNLGSKRAYIVWNSQILNVCYLFSCTWAQNNKICHICTKIMTHVTLTIWKLSHKHQAYAPNHSYLARWWSLAHQYWIRLEPTEHFLYVYSFRNCYQ